MRDIQGYEDFVSESYTPNEEIWYVADVRNYHTYPMFFKRGPGGFSECKAGEFVNGKYVPGEKTNIVASFHNLGGQGKAKATYASPWNREKTRSIDLTIWNGKPVPQTFYLSVDGKPMGVHDIESIDRIARSRKLHAYTESDNGYSFDSTDPIEWPALRAWLEKGPKGMYTDASVYLSTRPAEKRSHVSFS